MKSSQHIYPKNMNTPICQDIRTHMFVAALFTIAKAWEPPECPSMDERIKMWYIHSTEYSAIKMIKYYHL